MQAGETPTSEFLNFINAFKEETEYTVWSVINSCIAKLSILISHTDLGKQWEAFQKQLFVGIYQRLGWEAKESESKFGRVSMFFPLFLNLKKDSLHFYNEFLIIFVILNFPGFFFFYFLQT